MDSGVLADNETFEDEFDVLREILPGELIGLMDQILCHEVRSLGAGFEIWSSRATYLMLILGLLDGMAYGLSAFTVTVLFISY